jgi:hypothetical protein
MSARAELEVVVHIGGAKCGSSAIQAWLAQNAVALVERGIGVPGKELDFESAVSGEQIWAFERAATTSEGAGPLRERLSALFAAAEERGLSRVLLSAENICNHAALAAVMAGAAGERPVRIVMYVRRQDDFLISSWQQWHLKRYDSLEGFLADKVGSVACWLTMLEPWAAAFGDNRIAVRRFAREHMAEGDVVADFCRTIGLDASGLTPLSRAANPSFDEALGRLAHRVRDVFADQHDNRFYEVMVRLLGKAALKSDPGSSLLDLDTRRRIVARYAAENMALKARFLPDLGEDPLFPPPAPGEVRSLSADRQVSDDIAMLTRAVYALAAKLEKGE